MLPGKSHPLDIPPTLKAALQRVASNEFRRGRHGWTTPSAADLKFHTVTSLKMKSLVEIRHGNGRDRLALTELGKAVVEAMASRRRRTVH